MDFKNIYNLLEAEPKIVEPPKPELQDHEGSLNYDRYADDKGEGAGYKRPSINEFGINISKPMDIDRADAIVNKYSKTRLARIVDQPDDNTAIVAWIYSTRKDKNGNPFPVDISAMEVKYQNALKKKMDDFARAYDAKKYGDKNSEGGKPSINKDSSTKISNINNILTKLSSRSLSDLLYMAQDLQKQDAKYKR